VGAKAAKDHARYRELFAWETIAAQQLDQAKAADEVARATVEAARKQVAQAEEALELARASRVAVALRQKEVQIAVEQVREARAAVETAQAQVQSTEANRLLAQANLKDTRVVAPFTGTVIKKLVQVGTERVLRGARCPLLEIPALRKDALETVRQQ
jgi:multidrug resistance efflux pump